MFTPGQQTTIAAVLVAGGLLMYGVGQPGWSMIPLVLGLLLAWRAR